MKTTLLILSLTLLQNCSKSDDTFTPTLPPITQTGANTFGVYIDGNLLVPRNGDGTFNLVSNGAEFVGAGGDSHEIIIHDYKSGNAGLLNIHIIDLFVNGEGNFPILDSNCLPNLDANPTINIYCRWKDEQTGENKYYCSIEGTGFLKITRFDLPNRIVSGTFSCSAVNRDDPNDIIEITDGRFDFHWATINEKEFP
jgi:hypothetical protein